MIITRQHEPIDLKKLVQRVELGIHSDTPNSL